MPVLPDFTIDNIQFGTTQADTLTGGNSNDLVFAGAGNDDVSGRGGQDVLFGNRGADDVSGGAGDDILVWTNGDGSDDLSGGSGIDTLVVEGNDNAGETFLLGPDNGDTVFQRVTPNPFELQLDGIEVVDVQSLGGNDRFTVEDLDGTDVDEVRYWGGDGADRLDGQGATTSLQASGEDGNDRLTGGSQDDQLHGDDGNDILRGNGGDDWLVGGDGNDTLNGGSGRDVLEGWDGDDQLTGGGGRDAFVFRSGEEGDDTIQDFSSGNDRIVLLNFGNQVDFDDLEDAITEQGGDTVIDLGDLGNQNADATITVADVTGLEEEDFVFL